MRLQLIGNLSRGWSRIVSLVTWPCGEQSPMRPTMIFLVFGRSTRRSPSSTPRHMASCRAKEKISPTNCRSSFRLRAVRSGTAALALVISEISLSQSFTGTLTSSNIAKCTGSPMVSSATCVDVCICEMLRPLTLSPASQKILIQGFALSMSLKFLRSATSERCSSAS